MMLLTVYLKLNKDKSVVILGPFLAWYFGNLTQMYWMQINVEDCSVSPSLNKVDFIYLMWIICKKTKAACSPCMVIHQLFKLVYVFSSTINSVIFRRRAIFPWVYLHNNPQLIDQSECVHWSGYYIKHHISVSWKFWTEKRGFPCPLNFHNTLQLPIFPPQ